MTAQHTSTIVELCQFLVPFKHTINIHSHNINNLNNKNHTAFRSTTEKQINHTVFRAMTQKQFQFSKHYHKIFTICCFVTCKPTTSFKINVKIFETSWSLICNSALLGKMIFPSYICTKLRQLGINNYPNQTFTIYCLCMLHLNFIVIIIINYYQSCSSQ